MSGIASPALGTTTGSGGATSTNVTQWGSASTSLGQKSMAQSVPVVIASDQSTVPVSVDTTITPLNINIVSPLGPATKSNSLPVTMATDQPTTHVESTASDGGVVINDPNNNYLYLVHNGDVPPAGGYGPLVYGQLNGANVYAFSVDNTGALYVNANQTNASTPWIISGNIVSGGADGSSYPVKTAGRYNSTPPTFTDGQRGDTQIDAKGNALTQIRDAAGNARGANVNASSQLSVSVDNTVTVGTHAVTVASGGIASGAVASGAVASGAFASGSIGSGAIASGAVASGAVASGAFASGSIAAGAVAAGATSFVKLEDVASADADAGVPALAVRKATPANTSGTDGDYEFLQMSGGRLWVNATIKADTYGTATSFTITFASLANSTAGVGRQSTLITGNTAPSALIQVTTTMGTSPTANSLLYVYLIRGDGSTNDDNAGSSDAGITIVNAPLLGTILVSAATSNAVYYGLFDTKFLGSLGPTFGIAIVNSSGATLNSGTNTAKYTLIT